MKHVLQTKVLECTLHYRDIVNAILSRKSLQPVVPLACFASMPEEMFTTKSYNFEEEIAQLLNTLLST
jgi:F0F1-type ATP synthase gamma subunit